MIELLRTDRSPVGRIMALGAVVAQSSLVRVLVTTDTRLREAEERAVQIFDLDAGALGSGNLLRRMALLAGESRVLAFQLESGEGMVEGFRVPLNQGEIFAVVVGVASRTSLARSWLGAVRRVQALVRGDARGDLGMAVQTLEYALASESVAGRAICRAVQGLVRARQLPRRNLRVRRTVQAHGGHNYQKTGKKWMLRSHVVHESTQTALNFCVESQARLKGAKAVLRVSVAHRLPNAAPTVIALVNAPLVFGMLARVRNHSIVTLGAGSSFARRFTEQ